VATGDVAHHSFTVVRRGFDTDEVRSYLQAVARNIDELEHREEELRAAIAEAEERAANPVIDEATLTASLGQHSAQVLRHAHDEAARIVVQAQEASTTLLRDAQSQADEIQARGEASSAQRVAETELMVATAEEEARVESTRLRAEAIADGEDIITRAKDEGRAVMEQVQAARKRVLADMSTRRRALSIQIEQLRAARDEMAASIHGVRDSVDGILGDLKRSDEDARSAAAVAGDEARLRAVDDEQIDVELVDVVPMDAELVREVPTADDPVKVEPTEQPRAEAASDPEPITDETPKTEPQVQSEAAAEPVAEPEPVAAVSETEGDEPESVGDAPSVDELFARIRAGSDDAPAEAVASAEEAAAPEDATENPDQALITRRDELLVPVMTQLSRHLKRALGDDQNRLLDVLRSAPSTSVEELLGPEDAQSATFSDAAKGHLADAFSAGVKFGGGKGAKGATEAAAQQASASLARMVVTMLRRRIEDGTDDGEDVGARVGAAFREWRGERIERLVGDCVVQSFSAGVLAAATKKGTVRWILTTTDGCSDCDDNALAGSIPVSEGFPTGHAGPPAHAGCRCLVAPSPG
jgi:DivIVA domain-containing protein